MKKAIFLLASIILSNETFALEQNSSKELFAIHPKGSLGVLFHSSDFSYLNQQISCGKFASGSGISFSGGVNFELPLSELLWADLGIHYKSLSGDFEIERLSSAYDLKNNKSTIIRADNKIASNLAYLKFEPGIKYKAIEDLLNGPLFINLGLGIGIPVSNTFTQTENIKSPQNAYFINDNKYVQSRQLFDGDIDEVNGLLLSFKVGAENHLKMSEQLSFTQGIGVEYNLNSVISHSSWNILDLNFALGLRYSFIEPEKAIAPPPAPVVEPPKPIEKPKPVLAFKFDQVNTDNLVINTGNELASTQTLLNVVFFESNSASIPDYYSKSIPQTIDYNKLNAVEAQKYNLVRIAEIVKNNDNAMLTISGATSSISNEPAGIELAKQRANNVKQALIDLGVSSKKIETKWTVVPSNPTNQEYKEGIEENQRVDITLKNAPLQKYVFEQNYAELKGNLDYYFNMQNFDNQTPAEIKFNFPDTTINNSANGKNTILINKRIDDSQKSIRIKATAQKNELTANDEYVLNLEDIKKKIIDLKTSNFKAIIRFDYNSSKLSDDNKELVRQLVKVLSTDAKVRILGSADLLGSEASNKILEEERAKNTQEFIRSINSNISIETGINTQKFDESSPIGRFLNRSIILTVE